MKTQTTQPSAGLIRLLICAVLLLVASAVRASGLGRQILESEWVSSIRESVDVYGSLSSIGKRLNNLKETDEPRAVILSDSTSTATTAAATTASVPTTSVPPERDTFEFEERIDGDVQLGSELPLPEAVSTWQGRLPFSYITPLSGEVSSVFGYRLHPIDNEVKYHYGIDIAAEQGAAIRCFADGIVTHAAYGSVNGNFIKIEHSGGFTSMYAHMSEVYAEKGDTVSMGETIGLVGETGKASGPHLHFQLYNRDKLIDPAIYLEGAIWS